MTEKFGQDTYPHGEWFLILVAKDLIRDTRKGLDKVTRPLRDSLESNKNVVDAFLKAFIDSSNKHL